MEGRIKCVVSESGIIIPIHNIWSNADAENSNRWHKLSDNQYDALVRELEIIGKY